MTVKETLMFAAMLNLPNHDEADALVEKVLSSLSLEAASNVIVGGACVRERLGCF